MTARNDAVWPAPAGPTTVVGMTEQQARREFTALDVVAGHDLTGRETIVTGGYSGIGYETAKALGMAGARVVLVGRDHSRGEQAAASLRDAVGHDRIVYRALDLADLSSVGTWTRKHVATGKPLHILVNNAGVMGVPYGRTVDGFERHFGVNHLGHFAFTLALLPCLVAADGARVVSLTSSAHRRSDVDFADPLYQRRPYDPSEAYGQSKTANALFAVAMTARHGADKITTNAVMPGAVRTELQRHLSDDDLARRGWTGTASTPQPGWKTPEQGAATAVWAATATELDQVSGRYLEDCAIAQPCSDPGDLPRGHYRPYALDPDHADRLWQLSADLLAAR
jgi:NAD(P)-dependent dehydrogenase (short-subunit alcohol dehydrogenase family)